MNVHARCPLDFRKCAPCQTEMQLLISTIYVNANLQVAIASIGLGLNPIFGGFEVHFPCNGKCDVIDNTLTNAAEIVAWSC